MELSKIAELVERLPKEQKLIILELIDMKLSSETKEMFERMEKLEIKLESKIEQVDEILSSKYNTLIGMISFLGFVLTAVALVVGLHE